MELDEHSLSAPELELLMQLRSLSDSDRAAVAKVVSALALRPVDSGPHFDHQGEIA